MTRIPYRSHVLLAAALLATGCATQPATTASRNATESFDCTLLAKEIALARETRRNAQQKEQDAWKALLPFAVAGRYASAHADVSQADQLLARLEADATRKGCASHPG
jgi:hypothetical protein